MMVTQDGQAGFRYWAFISYSQHDAAWAARLHEALERYRIPRALVGRPTKGQRIPARLMPIFRDRDELAGSPDLEHVLQAALAASASLVVVCSRDAATSRWVEEEVHRYKQLGHAERVFALIVPGAGDGVETDVRSLFPKALLHDIEPDGTIGTREIEPLAADVRRGKDDWTDALLKLVAGILDVRFDDLRQRELRRRRRTAMARASMAAAGAIVLALAFVALADLGTTLPGAPWLRRALDHVGLTLFRPVANDARRHVAAVALRQKLRTRLLAAVVEQGIEPMQEPSAWTVGQVGAALLRDPDLAPADRHRMLVLLAKLFRLPDGRALLGTRDDVGNRGRLEPIVWTVVAVAGALQQPLSTDERTRLSADLRLAQRLADRFDPQTDGGWNTHSEQADTGRHFVYSTALALHMLLQVREAGLGWNDDRRLLDQKIGMTADWLARAFAEDGDRSGWRRSLDDEKQPDRGLTLFVASALGRACASAGVALPAPLVAATMRLEADLRDRAFDDVDPDLRFDFAIGPTNSPIVSTTRVIWYPWAVEGLVAWRACAQKNGYAPETQRALARSLDHLLFELASLAIADVTRQAKPAFVLAETHYGIDAVP